MYIICKHVQHMACEKLQYILNINVTILNPVLNFQLIEIIYNYYYMT